MEKKTSKTLLITTVLCLLPIILALVLYDRLPEQIAIHFDSTGAPDNYLPKALAVFWLAGCFGGCESLFLFQAEQRPETRQCIFRTQAGGEVGGAPRFANRNANHTFYSHRGKNPDHHYHNGDCGYDNRGLRKLFAQMQAQLYCGDQAAMDIGQRG